MGSFLQHLQQAFTSFCGSHFELVSTQKAKFPIPYPATSTVWIDLPQRKEYLISKTHSQVSSSKNKEQNELDEIIGSLRQQQAIKAQQVQLRAEQTKALNEGI